MTIGETAYEDWINAECSAGRLCRRILSHGDPCGREIDNDHGLGLCQWHSEDELGLPHVGDPDDVATPKNVCGRCQKRPVAFRVTRLCGNCHKVMHRQHTVESGARKRR